jgi:uncharacterized protein YjbJ (UPF0337 family)
MGDRTDRVKGKANEISGRTQADVGYSSGSGKTEAKGLARTAKGKAQQAAGKAKGSVKKATR